MNTEFELRNTGSTPRVLMLLTNRYDPDPRVRQEALSLVGLGCRVRVLAWDRDAMGPEWEVMEGIEIERLFISSTHGRGTAQMFFYAIVYLRMLWRACRLRFDVVHCHDLDTLPLGYVLGIVKRRAVVYDAHESFPDMLGGSVHPGVRRVLVWMENFFIKRVDLLITVGEKLRSHFASRGAYRSVVVGNWKRLGEFAFTREQNLETRRRLGLPDNALVIVCITQLLRDRKIEPLLDAIDESPDWHLVIAGRGVLEEVVAARAGRNPRILNVGFVSSEQIPAYTCASDVVYYGFDPANPNARFSAPNKLSEALVAGRPLITGDFGEIAEVVRRAECGMILPEYSTQELRKALRAMADPQLRQQLGENAARFGRAFLNWEKGEEILHREYSALLPNRFVTSQRGQQAVKAAGA